MDKKHDSDSSEQREVEQYVIKTLSKEFNIELSSVFLPIINGVKVQIDGYNQDEKILIEVYSGIETVKGGQSKKVITDAYKLLFIERTLFNETGCRKILCFIDQDVLKKFQANTWQSQSLITFGIELKCLEIPVDLREILVKAKERQKR